MKKFLSALILILCGLNLHAGEYDYLTFITSAGSQQIESADLVMTISGSNLIADNGKTKLTLALAEVQKMYFSDESGIYTDLENTSFDNDATVSVFNLEGKHIGKYANMSDAVRALSQGTYIVRQNANSLKILVP